VNTGAAWKSFRDPAYSPLDWKDIDKRLEYQYYVAGSMERVDGARYPWGWEQAGFDDSNWQPAQMIDPGAPIGVESHQTVSYTHLDVYKRQLFPTGNDLGFRRPGFAISAEPGIQYSRHGSVLTLTIARAVYRDRTRSVPDLLTDGHGDAAFANWVWLASYSFRAGGKHGEEPSSQQPAVPPAHGASPAPAAPGAPSGPAQSTCQ